MIDTITTFFRDILRPYRKKKRKRMLSNKAFSQSVCTVVSEVSDEVPIVNLKLKDTGNLTIKDNIVSSESDNFTISDDETCLDENELRGFVDFESSDCEKEMSEIENKIKNCTTVKEDFSKMNIDDVRNVCNDKLKRENDFKRNNEITEKNKITSKNYLIKMKDLENNRSKNQEPNTKNDDTKFRYLNTANNQQVNHFIEKNSQLNKELPTTYQKNRTL